MAHIHHVLIGGSIMALIAGIYYWFPRTSGRTMNETLGKAVGDLYACSSTPDELPPPAQPTVRRAPALPC